MSSIFSARGVARRVKFVCLSLAWLLFISALAVNANAQTRPPVLISEPTSTRAIALESVTFLREPFSLTSPFAWSTDRRTRLSLFALNLTLQPGENLSVVTADAEDAAHRHYNLQVEAVTPVPQQEWLSAVVLRLSDDLTIVGDVLVRVTYRGVGSNRVRLGIGQLGGGLPDDAGAAPTLVPPYLVSGQVTTGGSNFGGVTMTLSGAQTQTLTTDAGGLYSFTVTTAADDYTLTPSHPYYDFTPSSRTFHALSNNQPAVNFIATRRMLNISGLVAAGGTGFGGVTMTLSGPQILTTPTGDDGLYSFTVAAGEDYTLAPSKIYYTFSPQSRTFSLLSSPQPNQIFVATRQLYDVNGRVLDDVGQGVAGIEVRFFNDVGGAIRTAQSDAGGNFSFPQLNAGYNYSVAATNNSFLNFTPQSISPLNSNLTLTLNGVRALYRIYGKALDETSHAFAGVTVNLSGSRTATATTDSDGNYSFPGLPAGGNYVVVASKRFYRISPQPQSFNNLAGNGEANFSALLQTHRVSGRVTDGSGNGILGVAINLSGEQAITVRTASDGSFSLIVLDTGNYTLTPSIEQDRYVFAPSSVSLQGVSADQSINLTATFVPISEPTYVLEYDGAQKTVDYGYFWEPYVDLGQFYWEFWAMPGSNAGATYMLSDGYGGAHALLFGFANYNVSEPGRYQLFGNTWDGYEAGQHVVFFASDEGPAVGEWGHFAVGWDGQNIITYFDGVPVGKNAFAGPRATPGTFGGGSKLLIGGSDHNNLDGRIAQVRGYEGRNPLADANGTSEAAFAPQTIFGAGGNLLSHFFRPAPAVADLSLGNNGVAHPGTLRGTTLGVLNDCGSCPPPRFVIDPTAPNFVQGIAPQPVNVPSPPPVPNQARAFDSFSRANSTYLFNGQGGLGSTEGGTTGAQVWQTSAGGASLKPFGLLNGRAVLLANQAAVAWIANGARDGNVDVRVDRHPGTNGSGLDTGLSFRVVDSNNLFFAYTSASSNAPAIRNLTVGYYQNGVRTELVTGINLPANWSTLRVVSTSDGNIKVYALGTLVYSTSNNVLVAAAGAGLYNNSSGLGLVNRWDNFTVYDVP